MSYAWTMQTFLVLGLVWCLWLLLTAVRARLTFAIARFPDPRWYSWHDLPVYTLVGLLLAGAVLGAHPGWQRWAAVMVGFVLAGLWQWSRALELREAGLILRGSVIDWSSIRGFAEQPADGVQRFRLAVQWQRPRWITVDASHGAALRELLQGASRYEPQPLLRHLGCRVFPSLLALSLLAWAIVTVARPV
ncbi:MAG: hypothetical protein KDA45_02665 [Planctomycetales bacterium]|nr:hypothetical protein [Planctomycetales bacterium]